MVRRHLQLLRYESFIFGAGACILAACFAVQLVSVGEQVARTAFQEKLLFSDSFDRCAVMTQEMSE